MPFQTVRGGQREEGGKGVALAAVEPLVLNSVPDGVVRCFVEGFVLRCADRRSMRNMYVVFLPSPLPLFFGGERRRWSS